MKILITGGCGFIGSHLAQALVKDNHEVHIIDNCNFISKNFIEIEKDIFLHKADIEEIIHLREYFDVIIHLAAISTLGSCEDNKWECFKVNYIGTRSVVEFAKRYSSYLIFASSREVYGDPQSIPVKETHTLNPKNCYGVSKALAEKEIIKNDIDYVILRIANVYGYGDRPERAIPSFIINGIKRKQINIYGGESGT